MKLYAALTNSKGKKEGIGDNKQIEIRLSNGNYHEYTIIYKDNGIELSADEGIIYTRQKQQGEKVWCKYHNHFVDIDKAESKNADNIGDGDIICNQ